MCNRPNVHLRHRARESGACARVYFAAPKSEYCGLRYSQLLAIAARLFPKAALIESRTAFADVGEWRARWPAVLFSISALVFIASSDGWIGRGVWAEIREAKHRIPVYLLTDRGHLLSLSQLNFSRPNPEDWTCHVRVTVNAEG